MGKEKETNKKEDCKTDESNHSENKDDKEISKTDNEKKIKNSKVKKKDNEKKIVELDNKEKAKLSKQKSSIKDLFSRKDNKEKPEKDKLKESNLNGNPDQNVDKEKESDDIEIVEEHINDSIIDEKE